MLGLLTLTLAALAADALRLDDDDFDVRVVRWNETLDSIAHDLARDGITRSQIAPLSDDLSTVQSSVLIARDRAASAVDEQQRLLDALGPKPGEDEPAESEQIAKTRSAILRRPSAR